MPDPLLEDALANLPWLLRLDLDGYLRSIEVALDDIYRDAEVDPGQVRRDDLLRVVAVRRIWTKVNGQYWIVRNAMAFGEEQGIERIQAGSSVYARASDGAGELRRLRHHLLEFMQVNELRFLERARSVRSILLSLAMKRPGGG